MLPTKKENLSGAGSQYEQMSRAALIRLLEEHDEALIDAGKDGITMSYTGRTAPWQIIRLVKPKLSRIVKKFCQGEESTQCENEIWDGENLSTMVTLYKYRGQVDLILTDPPYNTGEDFRYNDKWDKDPNDPDLGDLGPEGRGLPPQQMASFYDAPRLDDEGDAEARRRHRHLHRPPGALPARHADGRDLSTRKIGSLSLTGKSSRRKATSGIDEHVSFATEYVLFTRRTSGRRAPNRLSAAKQIKALFPIPTTTRTGWASRAICTARTYSEKDDYAIQSPFTGELYYPAGKAAWRHPKRNIINGCRRVGSVRDGLKTARYVDKKTGKVPALRDEGQVRR